MATDSTNLPLGETNVDAGSDMTGSELDLTSVQLAQVEGAQPVELPKGNQVVLVPVQPGQVIQLPTDSVSGLLAKIGPEGNLAFVVDGRTIILQGYLKANEQSPVKIVTNDGDAVDVADVVGATDSSLDIQTAAGPATGGQGDGADGSGIFIPFAIGPGLGGIGAEGVLGATALQYKLIDDDRKEFTLEEDTGPSSIDITFDILGGIVNEDDLPADADIPHDLQAFKLVVKDQGNDGTGNDPFDDDTTVDGPKNDKAGNDDTDGVPDPDREPLVAQAFVKVTFGDDIPGTLWVDETKLPTGLTSEGEEIVYEVLPPSGGQGNGIVAFVDNNGDGHFDESDGDRIVFDIKVLQDKSDSEFTIDFTLHDNIDNVVPDVNDDGKADLLGGVEEVLGLPVQLTAKDSDGTSLSTVMNLGVQDDIPFFGEATYFKGEGGITVTIEQQDADIEHDESKGVQNSSDDQHYSDAQPWVQPATQKVIDAGFGLPYGDSEGALWPKGIAQTQVIASFGADQATQEHWKKADDASARNSVFGELQDRETQADGVNDGENERPFELFMTKAGTGGVPSEDDLDTLAVEGNLTIQDQLTNATVTWDGGEILNVFIRQIDAQTIIGYVIPEGQPAPEAREVEGFDGENGEQAVFVLTIDDNGVMTFVQYHQLNHPDFPDNHDEEFEIADANGDPLIHVRISDFDGDHAQQPVKLVVEDDGPKFKDVCFTHGNGTVDEDLLPGGNLGLDFAPGDESLFDGTSTSGTINFSIGVDKPGTLSFGGLVITDQAGNPIDITALKTADGNGVELLPVSGPDGNGVVTWQAVEIGTGDPVFKMTLDTSGGDMGDFKFTLQQALSHPYTDSDLNNDDSPESRYEDNFNFGFNVIATDIDKDTAQGTINIVIDDDSPKALDDFDVVTEGKTGSEWNYASGNVVTGGDSDLLGKDSHPFPLNLIFDGTPDLPGADRPYTISKLVHDGDVYTLSDDGTTVLKNGGDLEAGESFAGGILKISTAEGGTFEIVMISNTQSQVGEYKYTVPQDADHDVDFHIGPVDLTESLGDKFNSVSEWTEAYDKGGITIEPIGGSLAIKSVDVQGAPNPNYRGIGVASSGGDEAEVDTFGQGGSEGLKLTIQNDDFPGGVNNASLLLGALFNGQQFDDGFQEIVKWEVLLNGAPVASGQIVGDFDGLVTLDIDTGGAKFNQIILTPLNNGAPNDHKEDNSDFQLISVEICKPLDKFEEEFDYTLRDSDGDESTATLTVGVKDTEPKFPTYSAANISFKVDEDGIAGGNKDVQPGDATESTTGGNVDNDGIHIGKINFTPGFDPVTIELTVGNGGDTGLDTVDGKNVFAAWDAATSTLIGYIEGTDPSNAANRVFTMKVDNHQTGDFTFKLLKPVEHPDSNPQLPNADENNPDLSFVVNIQIEDKDCDTIFGKATITIDDDMPVITQQSGNFTLYVDESLDGNSTPNNAGDHPHNPGTRIEDDEDGAGLPGVLTGLGGVIGASKAGASALFSYSAGADGQQSAVYSFGFTPGADTGLIDSQSNSAVVWVQNGAVLEGRSTTDNHLVIALTIDPSTGEVAMAQYRAINHGGEEGAPGNHDEVLALGGGKLSVILTVTDKDDDTVSSSVDLGGRIKFDDDGPKADIDKKEHGDNQVLHDESAGLQNDDQPNGNLPGVFSAAGLIGWARSGDPVVTTSDSDYGTDGAGTTVLSLKVDFDGVNSGLDDTATGNNILLFQGPGGIVEGRVQGSGELVFAVSINQNGTVDVAQYRAIEHPNPNDHDEEVGISNSALQAWVTVTDKDGDSDIDHVDIGSRVRFDDDGPMADIDKTDYVITLDESKDAPAGDGYPDGNANDEAGNVNGDIAYAKVAGNLLFTDNSVFGTDGPNAPISKVYSLALSSNGTFSGLFDSETNDPIDLVRINDTTVEGRVDTSGPDPVAFRITIDPATGEVTISQFRAVEHNNNGSSASDHDESGSPEIMDQNKLFIRQTVIDGDEDRDSDEIDLGKMIRFEDDGPIARNDVDALDPIAGNKFESQGNVITGSGVTTPGVDDGGTDTPWVISNLVGSKSSDSNPSGGFNVTGTYGTLSMNSGGQYTYNFDEPTWAGKVPSGSTEVFTYTLKDSDGDTDTATLTINLGEATVQTSAVVNPQGASILKEDVETPIALTATPGAGDRVTQIVLDDIPVGWTVNQAGIVLSSGTLGVVTLVGDTLTININGAAAGVAITATVPVTAAADSDVDGDNLVVQATVVDGVVFASGSSTFDVLVDAVLDEYLDVAAGAIAPLVEPVVNTPVNLNLTSAFAGSAGNPFANSFAGGAGPDGDNSEVVNLTAKITITGDAAQLQLSAPIAGVTLTETATPGVWELTADTLANLQTALTQVQAIVPAGFTGAINGSVEVTTKEANTPQGTVPASGGEPDTTDNTYTDKTDFSIQVQDGVSTPTVGVNFTAPSLVIKEDNTAFFIVTASVPDATDKISQIAITQIEALILDGWTVTVTGEPGTTGAYAAGVFTVTSVGQVAQVRVTLTPPEDSDRDVINDVLADITVQATAADISNPALTANSSALTVDVDVDAVLDEYFWVGNSAVLPVTESAATQNVNLGLVPHVTPAFFPDSFDGGADTDDSEVHPASVVIGITPLEIDLTLGAGVPAGTTLVESPAGSGSWVLTALDADALKAALAFVEAIVPANFDGQIQVSTRAYTEEANTPNVVPSSEVPGSGQEHDTSDNSAVVDFLYSLSITPDTSVTTSAVVGTQGAAYLKEDVYGPIALTATPGATDTVTQIVLSNVPAGWDVKTGAGEIVLSSGTLGVVTFVGGVLTINVTGAAVGAAITATIQARASEDSDVDGTGLTVQATVVDGLNTFTNAPVPFNVTVDAVLDQYVDVSNAANTVDETAGAQTVILNLTSAIAGGGAGNPFANSGAGGPDGDGSEKATIQITVDGPANAAGVDLVLTAGFPAGATLTETAPGSGIWDLTANSVGDVQAALTKVGASLPAGFDGTVSGSVTATTFEANTPPAGTVPASGNEPDIADNVKVDQAEYTLTVEESNKLPIAYDDKKCGDEAAPKNVNLLLVFDNSGSMGGASGIPGVTKLEAAQQAAINLLNAYAATGGDVRVMLVTFNSNSDREETWLNLADAINAINAIPQSGSTTNYEAAIQDAISGFNDTDGRGDFATHDNLVYFLSDGEPTTGGNADHSITNGTLTNWDNLLENPANQVDHVYAVGLGTGIPNGANNPNLIDVARPDGDNNAPNTVILVDDFNDLSATLTGTVGTLNEGNVIDGTIENSDPDAPNAGPNNDPDNVGDGFSHVSFFEYNHPTDNGLDITITWNGAGLPVVDGVANGENTVVNGTKVSFDTEHGRMTFDLSTGDYDFIAGSIDGGDKEEHFTYKITDSNDDQSNPADLTVCIKDVFVDKTPITYDDAVTGTEPGPQNANLLLVFDNSGSMDDDSGIPGKTKLQAAKEAAINLLNSYAATGGDVRVMLVTFNSGATREGAWLDIAAAIAAINAIPQSNNSTDYQDAIATAIQGFEDTDGRGDPATHEGFVYFLSDGQPTNGGNGDNDGDGLPNFGITPGTLTAWNNLLEDDDNNVEHVYAVGFGDGIPNGANNIHLQSVANPDNDAAPGDPNGTVLFVDNVADLEATLTGTVGTEITGNILNGTIEDDPDGPLAGAGNDADNPGDGPAHLSYFEYDSADNDLDIKITWDGVGAVAVDGVADGKSTVINGKEVSFDTDHGRMKIDFTDGDFKLVAGTISGGDKTEVFDYKITDVDGDPSNTSQLKVTIENLPGVVTIDDTTVNEGGIANIQVNLSEPAPVGGVTVNYQFQTKAGNTATSGSDYTVVTNSIVIPAGASFGLISVNAAADAFFEGNETYSVVITSVTGGGYTIGDDTGLVTIADKTVLDVPLNTHAVQGSGWPGSVSDNDFSNGNDDVTGENGEDGFAGENGDDEISGLGGDDNLDGEGGDDDLFGGNDDDRLFGDSGDDHLDGGSGDDLLIGGGDFDTYVGGSGNDWIEVDGDDLVPGRSINGGDGNDVLDIGNVDLNGSAGITNIEVITMEPGNDADTVTLSATDVLAMTDADNTLFIWGDSNDAVSLTGGGWTKASGINGDDGSTYNMFTNGAATIFVEAEVTTNT